VRVGRFELKRWPHVGVFAAGFVAMSIMLAHAFGRFHGGLR